MKKTILLIAVISLVAGSQLFAFNENKFTDLLQSFDKVAVPQASSGQNNEMGLIAGSKAPGVQKKPADEDFVWLKAAEVNKQLEMMIQGIESAKQVATALAIIVNLYNSDKISVEVALTAVQILKLRALFLKVFITNGNSELEIMINVLQDHENEFSKKVQQKTQIEAGINGRIKSIPQNNPAPAKGANY